MKYQVDDLNALIEAVQEDGGEVLVDPCMPMDVKFSAPPYKKASIQRRLTCGCRNTTRMVIEYNGEDGRAALLTACAVCDNIGAWPRYITAVGGN